jgi:hypothetical protein
MRKITLNANEALDIILEAVKHTPVIEKHRSKAWHAPFFTGEFQSTNIADWPKKTRYVRPQTPGVPSYVSFDYYTQTSIDNTSATYMAPNGRKLVVFNESAGDWHPFHTICQKFGYSFSRTENSPNVDKKLVYTSPNKPEVRLWSFRGGSYWSIGNSVVDTGNLAFGLEKRLTELS